VLGAQVHCRRQGVLPRPQHTHNTLAPSIASTVHTNHDTDKHQQRPDTRCSKLVSSCQWLSASHTALHQRQERLSLPCSCSIQELHHDQRLVRSQGSGNSHHQAPVCVLIAKLGAHRCHTHVLLHEAKGMLLVHRRVWWSLRLTCLGVCCVQYSKNPHNQRVVEHNRHDSSDQEQLDKERQCQ
jgi:hypothetical protein